MSEKRFKSVIDEDTMSVMPYLVSDNEEECFYNLQGCVDLLNEQQATIDRLKNAIRIAYEEKPYPTLEDIQDKYKELDDE